MGGVSGGVGVTGDVGGGGGFSVGAVVDAGGQRVGVAERGTRTGNDG